MSRPPPPSKVSLPAPAQTVSLPALLEKVVEWIADELVVPASAENCFNVSVDIGFLVERAVVADVVKGDAEILTARRKIGGVAAVTSHEDRRACADQGIVPIAAAYQPMPLVIEVRNFGARNRAQSIVSTIAID